MTKQCTRRLTFEAGHRVVGHENKCRYVHGHSYKVFVTAEAAELDSVGRVIDFSELKARIGGWIDAQWDHALILWEEDHKYLPLLAGQDTKLYVMPTNPTAENMAHYLLAVICPELMAGSGITITSVVVWETENCYAEAK